MKKTLFALCTLSTLVCIAGAQQVKSSSQASASGNTSVSSGRSGANVQSDANANSSGQTTVAAPERHRDSKEVREPKEPQPSGRSKDQESGAADAAGGLAAGTTVNAILAKSLDSGKSKPGDPVVATAAQDVKSDGRVVIRRGSRLIGHVTEVKPKGEGEANSSLGLVFDHAVLKDGRQLPMNSVVQALAAAPASSALPVGDDGFGAMGSGSMASSGSMAGRGSAAGGGLLGGVTSTARTAVGTVANVGGGTTGAVNSTLGSTANLAGGLQGALSPTSSGVMGLKGLSLASDAANSAQGSVITSPGKSVHLDSGTQMVLRIVNR